MKQIKHNDDSFLYLHRLHSHNFLLNFPGLEKWKFVIIIVNTILFRDIIWMTVAIRYAYHKFLYLMESQSTTTEEKITVQIFLILLSNLIRKKKKVSFNKFNILYPCSKWYFGFYVNFFYGEVANENNFQWHQNYFEDRDFINYKCWEGSGGD